MTLRCIATRWLVALTIVGCTHTDPIGPLNINAGPISDGNDVVLTTSPEQDYWPSWTADGQGILYSFLPAPGSRHRCIGMLPADGGNRIWEFCDDGATLRDSTNSFAAYALSRNGQLLYLEASALASNALSPTHVILWLADTARPLIRRKLTELPVSVGGHQVIWLNNLVWTGARSFTAMARSFDLHGHCRCPQLDTAWAGIEVVTGTIDGGGATLQAVEGTEGASGYSLAEDGATIVFTKPHDQTLYSVPAAGGGNPIPVARVDSLDNELTGVSCHLATCVVADAPITLSSGSTFPSGGRSGELRAVSLASGSVQVILTTGSIFTPQIRPGGGAVVAQVGGAFGFLQSTTSTASNLHLFPGLVP